MVVSEANCMPGSFVQLLLAMMDLHDTCGLWVVVGIRVYPMRVGPSCPALEKFLVSKKIEIQIKKV